MSVFVVFSKEKSFSTITNISLSIVRTLDSILYPKTRELWYDIESRKHNETALISSFDFTSANMDTILDLWAKNRLFPVFGLEIDEMFEVRIWINFHFRFLSSPNYWKSKGWMELWIYSIIYPKHSSDNMYRIRWEL